MEHVNRIACLTLLAFISTSLYGEEKKTSQAEAGGARVFNVLNYGAVGGDKTTNTAAFSARLQIGPPVIGAWFPQENEMRNPDGYRDFLDAAAGYSHYTLLSTTMRIRGRQMTDAYVHDWFKRAAAYARQRGVGLVLELDPRHSIPTFAQQYPKALQQRLWLREVDLAKEGEAVVEIGYGVRHGDAICGAGVNAIALERVYVYERPSRGPIPEQRRPMPRCSGWTPC